MPNLKGREVRTDYGRKDFMKKNTLINAVLHNSKSRQAILLTIDVAIYAVVSVLYWLLSSIGTSNIHAFWVNTAIHFVLLFLLRTVLRVYKNVWRYANTVAYIKMLVSDGIASLLTVGVTYCLSFAAKGVYIGVWRALSVGALTAIVTLSSRFCYSALYKMRKNVQNDTEREPVAIIGAGRLGTYLVGDLKNNPNSRYKPVFFVDTDSLKIDYQVVGLKVYDPETAENMIVKYGVKTVIIAITHDDGDRISKLYMRYSGLGCKVKICEGLSVSEGGNEKPRIREFAIEDLLFRKSININNEGALSFYCGKVVLVTGGGGSIGSEICRKIARCKPQKLIIFDIYENNAYDIQQELIRRYGQDLDLAIEIGSVRDSERLDLLFRTHKPDIVFHAAAHKHVPLMENSAAEAVKNNCLGTYNTANAAEKYGVEKFILISTDKAVNPTNIMGASKRMCEMIVQSRTDSNTTFAAVRFGNVLGSNGSVIPLFKRQIAEGGPVTITDKRIIRYFMTISEAAELVLESGAMAKHGELFVLDMGKPIKIYDLAVEMIKMSGFVPDKDIMIEEIGLRPGEKLYEELLIKSEELTKTENDLIFIETDTPFTREQVEEKIGVLTSAMLSGESCEDRCMAVRNAMLEVVPTYKSSEDVNRYAEESEEMKLALTNSK